MPDDHSDVVPLLPISNRTVKRVSADDSAGSCVKVGHRQALIPTTPQFNRWGVCFSAKGIGKGCMCAEHSFLVAEENI
jgi:hypothetical protein